MESGTVPASWLSFKDCRWSASIMTRHAATPGSRALLERQGTPIGANDTWIAAQALAVNAVLVTDNEGEFSRVPGLTLENWLAAQPGI